LLESHGVTVVDQFLGTKENAGRVARIIGGGATSIERRKPIVDRV
jgi:hypothetical protein